jgi:hypothetical protein
MLYEAAAEGKWAPSVSEESVPVRRCFVVIWNPTENSVKGHASALGMTLQGSERRQFTRLFQVKKRQGFWKEAHGQQSEV